jgi:UDPglucose--hexose-1-phosphate uridylyltransferase
MSELRRDPFTGHWVVVAEGRAARPNDHGGRLPTATADPECPFCEGHEDRTPPEVAAVRPGGSPPNAPGWVFRAIPNRFPTLHRETAPASAPGIGGGTGGDLRPGAGIHEVVIESPRHAPGMRELDPSRLGPLFRFLRDRVRALESADRVSCVVLFENWGPESGGTLWHPHAQLVATELLPPRLVEEVARFAPPAAGAGTCRLEAVTADERGARRRVLVDDPDFTVVTPFGSEHPYEMRFVPRRHAASFAEASDRESDRLAVLLPAALRALATVVPDPSYNWVIHGLPRALKASGSFHWHLELFPRLVRADGFELGAGIPVNPIPPELAATRLGAVLGPALSELAPKG